jgi:hypothetical protein
MHPLVRRPVQLVLIGAMVLGSLVLWIGVPIFWIWLASKLASSSQPSMGTYVLVLVAIPASMFAVGKLLGLLNRKYTEISGGVNDVRVQAPWLRSMRGERTSGRPRTVLDVVMVATVTAAFVCFLLWFALFAGSSLPTP